MVHNFSIFRYMDKNSMHSIDTRPYTNLHIISHGNSDGAIGFEQVDDQWKIDWVDQVAFSKYFSNQRRNLFFLSCCYSGTGTLRRPSLAFDLVKKGIATNVIAFSGAIGSQRTLPTFVTAFYSRYLQTFNASQAFNTSIDELVAEKNQYARKPVFYTADSI